MRLRHRGGAAAGREVEVRGPRFVIGRGSECDLVLDPAEAPGASARHAAVELEEAGAWLADLDSTNGTFLNGARIQRAALRPGDRIGLGEARFEVVAEGPLSPPAAGRRRAIAVLGVAAALALSALAFLIGRATPRRDPDDFAGAALRAAPALYLIALRDGDSLRPIGTAFAVSADGWLVTNAHVAATIREAVGGTVGADGAVAVRNDSAGERERIAEVRMHPGFRTGSLVDDVALLRLYSMPRATLTLARDTSHVNRGVRLATIGFPAAVTDPRAPRARLREHVVGDVRDHRYFELGEGIAPGCSGSPALDRSGAVVGIVIGADRPGGPGTGGWAISSSAVAELVP